MLHLTTIPGAQVNYDKNNWSAINQIYVAPLLLYLFHLIWKESEIRDSWDKKLENKCIAKLLRPYFKIKKSSIYLNGSRI